MYAKADARTHLRFIVRARAPRCNNSVDVVGKTESALIAQLNSYRRATAAAVIRIDECCFFGIDAFGQMRESYEIDFYIAFRLARTF